MSEIKPSISVSFGLLKVKVPLTDPKDQRRLEVSSTLSWSQHQNGVGGQYHAPAVSPPGKTRYPLYRMLGRPQGRSGRVRKISPPLGFDPRTVQPLSRTSSPLKIQAQSFSQLSGNYYKVSRLYISRKNGGFVMTLMYVGMILILGLI
jgi:hypothetical protein